jgi:hypothetical protein
VLLFLFSAATSRMRKGDEDVTLHCVPLFRPGRVTMSAVAIVLIVEEEEEVAASFIVVVGG